MFELVEQIILICFAFGSTYSLEGDSWVGVNLYIEYIFLLFLALELVVYYSQKYKYQYLLKDETRLQSLYVNAHDSVRLQ